MKVNWKWLLTGVAIPLAAAAIAGGIALAAGGKARIEIVADSNTYQLSPQLAAIYEKIRQLESSDELLSQLRSLLTPSDKYDRTKVDEYRLSQLSRDMAQAFTGGWGVYAYSLKGYNSQVYYYILRITNRGNKTANSVSLQARVEGYYRLTSPGTSYTEGDFSNAISLPDLRPGVTHFVELWSTYQLPTYKDDACVISYSDGVSFAKFPTKVYRRIALFFDSPVWWLPVASTSLLIIFAAFMIGRYYVTSTATRGKPSRARPVGRIKPAPKK